MKKSIGSSAGERTAPTIHIDLALLDVDSATAAPVARSRQSFSAVAAEVEAVVPPVPPPTVADLPAPTVSTRARILAYFAQHRLAFTLFGSMALINLIGLPYFVLPIAERLRSPMHPWFKATGWVGQSCGILATLLFAFLWLYPLRRRFQSLARLGTMKRWLELHVLIGLAVPLMAAIHAGWRFNGMIGLGCAAMLLVAASGIVGTYLYARIPRTRNGVEIGLAEAETRNDDLLQRIATSAELPVDVIEKMLVLPDEGPRFVLARLLTDDWRRWVALRRMRQQLAECSDTPPNRTTVRAIHALAHRQIELKQQMKMLDATQRVFKHWHVAHQPVAITALVAVIAHVSAAVWLGVTWFW